MKTQQHNGQFISPEFYLPFLSYKEKPFPFTFLLAGIFALTCLMSACEKTDYKKPQVQAISNATQKEANATGASSSAAIVTTEHFEFDVPYENTNPCNGELLTLNEHDKIDIHSVINNNRSNMQFHALLQYDGSDGQGNTYHGNLIVNQTENAPLENGAYIFHIVGKLNMIGNGSAPNFIALGTFKVTITPNGDIAVEKSTDTLHCGG